MTGTPRRTPAVNKSGTCPLIYPEEVERVMKYISQGYPYKLTARLLGMNLNRVIRCVGLHQGSQRNIRMERYLGQKAKNDDATQGIAR